MTSWPRPCVNNKMADNIVQAAIEKTLIDASKVIEDQLDQEIDRLDKIDEDDMEKLRQKRLKQMKQAATQKQEWLSKGHGKYEEVTEEKEFFDVCKKSSKIVCHFYRESTMRCKIVDKHLLLLAPRHIETKFVKLSVDRAPFLCERLKIRILPTISVVLNNVTKDFIKGFDDLGGTDDFTTEMLEWRLGVAGAVTYSGNLLEPPTSSKGTSSKSFMTKQGKSSIRSGHLSSDEDDD